MVGFCKLCNRAGSVHNHYRVCKPCWDTPEIREELTTPKEPDDEIPASAAPLPTIPTTAAPGTASKMLVMDQRATAKQQTCHPCDARYSGDTLPLLYMRATQQERAALIESKAKEQREKIEKLFKKND